MPERKQQNRDGDVQQQRLQMMGQLMQVLGDPLTDLKGMLGLQQGMEEAERGREQSALELRKHKWTVTSDQELAKRQIAQLRMQWQERNQMDTELTETQRRNKAVESLEGRKATREGVTGGAMAEYHRARTRAYEHATSSVGQLDSLIDQAMSNGNKPLAAHFIKLKAALIGLPGLSGDDGESVPWDIDDQDVPIKKRLQRGLTTGSVGAFTGP